MKKYLNYLKPIINNVIGQIIGTGIFALATAGVALLVSRQFSLTKLETWLLIFLALFIITTGFYLIYRKMNKKLPIYAPIDCDFHMIREERVHKWLNGNNYVHIRRYKIKALKNELTEYVDKFQWTGPEYRLLGGDGDYRVVVDEKPSNVFTVYRYIFNTPLNKGDVIELEAKWDAIGPAKPFFSTTIEEPTDELIMRVELFPKSGIRKVNCEEYSNIGAKCPPIHRKTEKLNSEGEYVWSVDKPKILHHYEINWVLKNNQSN